MDDVLPFDNSKLGYYVHRIYPAEVDIKNMADITRYASYIYLCLKS